MGGCASNRWSTHRLFCRGEPRSLALARRSRVCPCTLFLVYSRNADNPQVLNAFKLIDVTDDEGAVWDTIGHVVPAQYWSGPERRRKIWHTGEESWLNFRGKWGNKGENDCWWHRLVGICQVGCPPLIPFGRALTGTAR